MAEFRVVEYQQSVLGEALSKILPDNLQPAMREGEPQYLTGKLDLESAEIVKKQRKEQLKHFGHPEKVSVEIEELYT